jgi:hypothetical protein
MNWIRNYNNIERGRNAEMRDSEARTAESNRIPWKSSGDRIVIARFDDCFSSGVDPIAEWVKREQLHSTCHFSPIWELYAETVSISKMSQTFSIRWHCDGTPWVCKCYVAYSVDCVCIPEFIFDRIWRGVWWKSQCDANTIWEPFDLNRRFHGHAEWAIEERLKCLHRIIMVPRFRECMHYRSGGIPIVFRVPPVSWASVSRIQESFVGLSVSHGQKRRKMRRPI